MSSRTEVPEYRPVFPRSRGMGIGILGCGTIAQAAHLPAYEKYGLDVAAVWSRTPATTAALRDRFPFVRRVYRRAEDLLADPSVRIVDLATRPPGRAEWLERVVEAGKHVLAQKPLARSADELEHVVSRAERVGVHLAVNQNARWAPPWRMATLLIQEGAIGEVVGVTHVHDKPLPPIAGTHFDSIPHMLIADYLVHWFDITRCWLAGKRLAVIQAQDQRVPHQPNDARNPWQATVQMSCGDGASALIRVVGDVATQRPSCPFWVHGTRGTIRGSLLGGDFVELECGQLTTRYTLEGQWFVDGFAGAMAELMSAIAQDREPYHSARDNIATLRMVEAALASADGAGVPVRVHEAL